MPMPFCQSDRILAPTWALTSGTALAGYDVDKLTDQDPSNPLRVVETSIALRGTLAAPTRVDGVAVIHHNFAAGVGLRVTIRNGAGASVGTVDVTVPPWLGRFAPHLYFDVAAAVPSIPTRTVPTIDLVTLTANGAPIQIGELVVAGEVDTFSGILVDAKRSTKYGRTLVAGKKGPEYIHDRRTRDRQWVGAAYLDSPADMLTFETFQDASYGVRPFLIWPLNSITDEPIYARFVDPGYEETLPVDVSIARVDSFAVRELACGEAY
jgi:hypothetical protein